MKTFKQHSKESHGGNERLWSDPAEWLPAYYEDWCQRNPNHKECEDWRKGKKKEKKE